MAIFSKRFLILRVILSVNFLIIVANLSFSQEEPKEKTAIDSSDQPPVSQVEITGDHVEFSMKENKMIAYGNVKAAKDDVAITCDHFEFDRAADVGTAEGHVVLTRAEGRFLGDKLVFNYKTMKGDFLEAKINSKPFFGSGEKIARLDEKHVQMTNGYLTTCDHDKPHFRFAMKKVDIFPGDKLVARNVRIIMGKIPIMYLPRFSHDISGKRPFITYTPGYSKDWGVFLLTQIHHRLNDQVKLTAHFDARERKDIASGLDVDYDTIRYGKGVIRTYYMKERDVGKKHHFWRERLAPTPEKERLKVDWRHKWNIDEKTNVVWEYYRFSDDKFLKDYFEREFDKDPSPQTFFLFTKALPKGITSFSVEPRVNRYEGKVEKLPEIKYDLPNTQLVQSGVYLKSVSTYSNLNKKFPRPSEVRPETMRVDTDNELSYPMKLGFLEFKPLVGGRETYYSRTMNPTYNNSIRGIFRSGAVLSTKFYRVWDIYTDKFKLDVNRLRHIITPSVDYLYQHEPTLRSEFLDQYDTVDSQLEVHGVTFSIENKFQTKRKLKSVDLVRSSFSAPFALKGDSIKAGFRQVDSDVEIRPYSWLIFLYDSRYSTWDRRFTEVNTDLMLSTQEDKAYFRFGKRYVFDGDDQLTTELGYKINQKWRFRFYQRIDIDVGTIKEQEYTVRRDMHEWYMDINYNQTRGQGNEIWLVFTLKAFPDLGFEYTNGFNRRKPGSQSSDTPTP
ncbi:MAG: LPS assembly protein LptD [Candidatus Omnitrophica bacterium]|nr:LPS assembly protein LptD [Candidatus Omnitrophota bacterium]